MRRHHETDPSLYLEYATAIAAIVVTVTCALTLIGVPVDPRALDALEFLLDCREVSGAVLDLVPYLRCRVRLPWANDPERHDRPRR